MPWRPHPPGDFPLGDDLVSYHSCFATRVAAGECNPWTIYDACFGTVTQMYDAKSLLGFAVVVSVAGFLASLSIVVHELRDHTFWDPAVLFRHRLVQINIADMGSCCCNPAIAAWFASSVLDVSTVSVSNSYRFPL